MAISVVTETCCNVLGHKKILPPVGKYCCYHVCCLISLTWSVRGTRLARSPWNISCLDPWLVLGWWGSLHIRDLHQPLHRALPLLCSMEVRQLCLGLQVLTACTSSARTCPGEASFWQVQQVYTNLCCKLSANYPQSKNLHNPILCTSLVFHNSKINISFSFYILYTE